MYTTVMTTVIGVICTLLVIASLIWMAIAYRKSDEASISEKEDKTGRQIDWNKGNLQI